MIQSPSSYGRNQIWRRPAYGFKSLEKNTEVRWPRFKFEFLCSLVVWLLLRTNSLQIFHITVCLMSRGTAFCILDFLFRNVECTSLKDSDDTFLWSKGQACLHPIIKDLGSLISGPPSIMQSTTSEIVTGFSPLHPARIGAWEASTYIKEYWYSGYCYCCE